jgi:hypothetical protein
MEMESVEADVEACLDKALDLSRLELNMLTEGDIAGAEALARDRGRLMDMAWRSRKSIPQEQFLKKMKQLNVLHESAHVEAKRLHKLLKDDLLRIRKQGQLLSGYRPQVSSAMQEAHFVSKQG